MRRAPALVLFLVCLAAPLEVTAQTYSVDFNQFGDGVAAESLGIQGVTFASNPVGSWLTIDTKDLAFVGLGGTCLFQPNTLGSLDIAFQNPVSSLSFSFAQDNFDTGAQLKVELFSGSIVIGTFVQSAVVPDGGFYGEGFINLSPGGGSFNRIRISSVTENLIAIDNIRADGILLSIVAQPRGILQPAGSGGGSDSYTIANRGSVTASVALGQTGQFFSQSPGTFTLAAGGTQKVTLTGVSQGPGSFSGTANIISGGTTLVRVPVTLLSAVPPSGSVRAVASQNRIDLASVQGQNPNGSVAFRNDGGSTIQGIAVSDAPWLIPQSGVITIAPGQTVNVTFRIDRSLRPDGETTPGSIVGTLSLRFLTSASAREPLDAPSGTSLVSVVDTNKPATNTDAIPPLDGPAFFLTGVGHVTGGNNVVFISDVTIGNTVDTFSIGNVSLFFTPRDGSAASAAQSSIATLLPSQAVSLADIVKNVYNNDQTVGTLQIRTGSIANLSVAASIFNASDPRGTFGTAIPLLRSDRAITTGQKLYLPGLVQDATHRTNFYLQETAGGAPTVRTDFLNATGTVIGTRTDALEPFRMLQIVSPAPAGTVTAVVTQTGGTGSLSGYATPLDTASGDTWAVTDWNAAFGSSPTDKLIIPIAGSAAGALGTFFRTDVAATNIGSTTGNIQFTYRPTSGGSVVKTVNLAPNRSYVVADIVKNLFLVSGDSLGYIVVDPLGRSVTVTSRTYTTVANSTATFGTAVPAIPLTAAIGLGQKKVVAGLQDSSAATLSAATPATYRTNVDIVETTGAAATVRITLLFADGRSLAANIASKNYDVQPNQLFRINRITDNILGASRADYGDIRNLQLKFEVVSGSGKVIVTTSSTDNGTGDSILRVQ